MKRLFFCLNVVLLFVGATAASAGTYSVLLYAPNNPPYVTFEDANKKGIFIDIFSAISEITGDKFEFEHQPIARGLLEFDEGRIDIEPGVNPNWREHRKEPGLYSIPYAISEEVIVFAPGHKKDVREPADLIDEIVGIARGFSYPKFDAAFSTDAIIRVNNVSQTHLIEQLLKGRFRQIFVGLNTIQYLQSVQPEYRMLEIGNVVDVQNVMMRVHPQQAELLNRLNEALDKLIQEKKIDAIYDNYR